MARILLVDDEPGVRFVARRMLEMVGHSVAEAESGAECLEKLKSEIPDVILLDVMMPEPNGWEVCILTEKSSLAL
jgi:CheY-like chemotaxis protein